MRSRKKQSKSTTLTISLPEEMADEIRKAARDQERSLSAVVRILIKRGMKNA